MKRTGSVIGSIIILMILSGFTGNKSKVLIIGDSISMGYTPFVKEMMKEIFIVSHSKGNAMHTGYGLENVGSWLEQDHYDVILFNWGLWDLCYRHPDSKVQGNRDKINGTLTSTLAEYEKNLEGIVAILKEKSDAELYFITTSYVPPEEAGRFEKDAISYNKAAKKVMKKYDVKVFDIYKKSKSIHKKYGNGKGDVHYTEKGYEELGKAITSFLDRKF